jgi:hypothetical protein
MTDQMSVTRACEIGREISEINEAIEQASTAYGNTGSSKADFWGSALFAALTERREELRQELWRMG